VFGGLILLVGCRMVYGRGLLPAIRELGLPGLGLSLLEALSTVLFCLSIAWTTVANAMLAFGATPLLAALLARLLLGERLARETWWAIGAVGVGLGIVATGAWEAGGSSPLGVLAGVLSALTIAAFFVMLRGMKARTATPMIGPGWLLGALLALPFAEFGGIEAPQIGWAFVTGGVILPLAISLVSWGSRFLPAGEASMITLLEVITGPILVWWVLGEVPGGHTFAGGAVVFGALAAHSLWKLRAGA
jgi:drug/metabolite transporter (DMT)-like permease